MNFEFGTSCKLAPAGGTLVFRIIDHFGLDVADIESYGSASKIIKKNWKVAALASDMARGFCAWFILQHLRRYKSFITKNVFKLF